MTMIDTAGLPPMPDLACPAWCSADHGYNWRQHVEAGRGPFADGESRDLRTTSSRCTA